MVGVALLASLLTLVSMMKIWTGAFWGEPRPASDRHGVLRHQPVMASATVALVALTVAVAVCAGPLWDYCAAAGAQLADASRYVGAVRGS
jgi:multicomponent Na+:H+ antiporter subunit D